MKKLLLVLMFGMMLTGCQVGMNENTKEIEIEMFMNPTEWQRYIENSEKTF